MATMEQCPICGLYVPNVHVHQNNNVYPCAGKWVNTLEEKPKGIKNGAEQTKGKNQTA